MTVSELIKALQDVLATYGDVPVTIWRWGDDATDSNEPLESVGGGPGGCTLV